MGNSVRIPSEHASAEDWTAFHMKLRERVPTLAAVDPASQPPVNKEDYRIPEQHAQAELNPELVGAYKGWAHEAGLSQAQHDQLLDQYVAMEGAQAAAHEEVKHAGYNNLRSSWGYAFDEKVASATRVAELTGAPAEMVDAIKSHNVKLEIMHWLSNVAESYGAQSSVIDTAGARGQMTPAEAQSQIDEIMGNQEHTYWTAMPGSPERDRVIAEILRLRQLATGRGVHTTIGGQEEQGLPGGTLFAGSVAGGGRR